MVISGRSSALSITQIKQILQDPTTNLFNALLWLAYFIILIIAWWQLFKKAGEKGWKSLIPFYNFYTQVKLTWSVKFFWIIAAILVFCIANAYIFLSLFLYYGVRIPADISGWYILSGCLTYGLAIAILVLSIIAWHRLSKAFGHGGGFTVGLVFLPFIFILILAIGESKYQGNVYLTAKEAKAKAKSN